MVKVWVTLDSCRYDALKSAVSQLDSFDPFWQTFRVEERYSTATWTLPAHLHFMHGLLPQPRPGAEAQAALIWKLAYLEAATFFEVEPEELKGALLGSTLPRALSSLGIVPRAFYAMPCLNSPAFLSLGWKETKQNMDPLSELEFSLEKTQGKEEASFYLLNLPHTHYPYGLLNQPHLSGTGGALSERGDALPLDMTERGARWKRAQVDMAAAALLELKGLKERCPEMEMLVFADHGELFGEEGWYGHGPFPHPELLRVPFLSWT